MFSLEIGRLIAIINGGLLDKEIVRIKGDNDKCCKKCSNSCLYNKKPCCGGCCMCGNDEMELDKDFTVDGVLTPLPNIETRQIKYVCGPEGVGKSTYLRGYMKYYKEVYPKRDIFLFSRLPSDKAIDYLKPKRVKIDESLYENPIDIIEELPHGRLIVFDDIDTVRDKKISAAISKLKNDILEVGRHNNIDTLISSHLINGNNRNDTRQILNSAHSLTVFPKGGNSYQINYALSKYFGLTKPQIEKIMKLPSHWATINKKYPPYVLHENSGFMLE